MSYLRLRTVVHSRPLTAEDRKRLQLWGSSGFALATRLYEELAQHDGAVTIRELREQLHANTAALTNARTALEEHGFVSVALYEREKQISLLPVPEPPETEVPRTRGLFVMRHAGIDGTAVTGRFDRAELGRQLSPLDPRRAGMAIEVYATLLEAPAVVNYRDLLEDVTDYRCIYRAISDLEGVGAIRQCGDVLAVFPILPGGARAIYDGTEYRGWLRSVEQAMIDETSKPGSARSQIDRLLDLYYSLCDVWEHPPGNPARNRTWAIKLINGYTFEELRPWLVAFLGRPEFFEKSLGWAINKYGMTLETFARNAVGIGEQCLELQHGLGDVYWKRPLQRDPNLERFIA